MIDDAFRAPDRRLEAVLEKPEQLCTAIGSRVVDRIMIVNMDANSRPSAVNPSGWLNRHANLPAAGLAFGLDCPTARDIMPPCSPPSWSVSAHSPRGSTGASSLPTRSRAAEAGTRKWTSRLMLIAAMGV